MNKIQIIDLLVKIANGEEVPEKIKYNNCEYKFNKNKNDYECSKIKDWSSFYNKISKATNMIDCLNDEIEIIENKPERIEKIIYEKHVGVNLGETVCQKLNELIDQVNYLLEKSENDE